MRWVRLQLILGTLTASAGCGLMASGAHNAINEPRLALSEWRFERRCRSLAEAAWSNRANATNVNSNYREGYLDGYADYLRAGRTIDPMPVPPGRYARVAYHTPESLRAVNDYTMGFQQGAADAAVSGDRQRVIIPVALPCCDRPAQDSPQLLPPARPTDPPAPPPKNSDGERPQEPK